MACFRSRILGTMFVVARPTRTRLAERLIARSPLVSGGVRAGSSSAFDFSSGLAHYGSPLPTWHLKVKHKRASTYHFFSRTILCTMEQIARSNNCKVWQVDVPVESSFPGGE